MTGDFLIRSTLLNSPMGLEFPLFMVWRLLLYLLYTLYFAHVESFDIRITLKASAYNTNFNTCAVALSSIHPFFIFKFHDVAFFLLACLFNRSLLGLFLLVLYCYILLSPGARGSATSFQCPK